MLAVVARSAGAGQQKPLEIVRGASSRLPWAWDGLCFAVPFHEPSYEGSRDIVNNVLPSVFTGVTWDRDNRGNIVASLDASAYIDYADHPRHDQPSTRITAYARFRRVAAGDSWGGIFSNIYSTSHPYTTFLIGDSAAGDGKLNAVVAMGTTENIFTLDISPAVPTTEYVSAFLRWGEAALTLHVLGERGNTLGSIVGETDAGPIAYAAGKGIRINGNEGAPPACFNGKYSQVMVWKRCLTDVELASLVSDPFGWYSPRREALTVAAPFPVGPGMAALGMKYAGPSA